MKKFCIFLLTCIGSITSVHAQELPPEPASGFTSKAVIETRHHMVVSGHVLASRAGDAIINKGGNAVDAAIATQMVLNLVEPHASGIGGGGFLLYYDKDTGEVEAYDGRETAPQTATADMFLDEKGNAPAYPEALKGGLSVGTPGLLRMLEQVHKAHGKLAWKDLFEPAITLAEQGFPLSSRLRIVIESTPYIIKSPEAKALYFQKDGSVKPVGSIIKNQALAETFRTIANEGADAFYKGKLAKSIVQTVHNNAFRPGRLNEKDLANYQAVKRVPLCDRYNDYTLCSMPPPTSGGITLLQTLKMLERFNLKSMKPHSPQAIHLIMESTKFAFADRNKYIADCDFAPVPVKGLLAPAYINERSALINTASAQRTIVPGNLAWDKRCGKSHFGYEHPSTTHMSIIDTQGNAVSMTSSIEFSFGSGLMVHGFFLNNELTDFSLLPTLNGEKVANRIEPGKRPRSSMAPMLVFDKNKELYLVIGSPGGSRIISYVLQTLISVLDWNVPLNKAINYPHYATTGNVTELEKGTPLEQYLSILQKMGHKVVIGDLTSGLHGIEIKNEKLFSGVDRRREGAAVGK